ncbi:MAG: GtrA family protein [Phenylobacterium sp.]|uniref:GtrA family protein n=1 Tax=Phenylobacterium sp. TaxID=1871053 RepID=UPI0039189BAC
MIAFAASLSTDPRLRRLAGELARFFAVGATATVVHYAILIGLVELAHAALIPATTAGFIGGATTSYTLNRRVTFSHQPQYGRGLAKFFAVSLFGMGLNALIVGGLARLGLPYLMAQVGATGACFFWNFTAARLLVFRAPRPQG